jgi:hypothetical protein
VSAALHRTVLVTLLAALALAGSAAPAAAEFGPIQLVSKTAKEQADFAREPALSADGRFVAFIGRIGGRAGLFRKELPNGPVVLVVAAQVLEAPVNLTNPFPSRSGVEAPSISANGGYVAFDTVEPLDPADDTVPGSRDVYVADLGASPPTYRLASAQDGSPAALPGEAVVAPGVALSADGERVAFVDGGQIYVRDLRTERTDLISVKRDPATGLSTTEPVPGGAFDEESPGPALSADGTTVAWEGVHLLEQVPLLGDEEAAIKEIERPGGERRFFRYIEPLWRRVPTALEPAPPVRRIVGGGDPQAPGCPPGGTLEEPACQGPFPELDENPSLIERYREEGKGWGPRVPQLSADGDTVAVVGNSENIPDLFVIDMRAGLSRDQAVRRLTRWVNPEPGNNSLESKYFNVQYQPLIAPILECAISADGTHVAFTTVRERFPLTPPNLITPEPSGTAGAAELFEVNLEGDTIERATPGNGSGSGSLAAKVNGLPEQGGGATSPSFGGAEGRLLAFATDAYNLVSGDANDASDVFTVESEPPPPPRPSAISAPPGKIAVAPEWRLAAKAVSRPGGKVRIVAEVPGAGKLSARAKAQVGPKLRRLRVASGSRRAVAATTLRLELALPRRLRAQAHGGAGLEATVAVAFNGPGGKPLKQTLVARFRVHRAKAGAKKR